MKWGPTIAMIVVVLIAAAVAVWAGLSDDAGAPGSEAHRHDVTATVSAPEPHWLAPDTIRLVAQGGWTS